MKSMANPISRALQWLRQSGPSSPKHRHGWAHPITACLLHYALIVPSTIYFHDVFILRLIAAFEDVDGQSPHMCMYDRTGHVVTSNFLGCYAAILLLWRLITMGGTSTGSSPYRRAVLYEYTWLCNTTLVMAAIAIRTCRPVLATSFCVAVSVDQLLWWVDLLGWLLR